MGKLITAKIDVSKIDSSKLFKGKKGLYCDLAIWIKDEPDQFGNEVSIEQRTSKEKNEPKIYLGEGKFFVRAEPDTQPQGNDLPEASDDLPDFLK